MGPDVSCCEAGVICLKLKTPLIIALTIVGLWVLNTLSTVRLPVLRLLFYVHRFTTGSLAWHQRVRLLRLQEQKVQSDVHPVKSPPQLSGRSTPQG